MMEQFANFHLLRPVWLLAIPLMLLIWKRARPRKAAAVSDTNSVAPHLAEALKVGEGGVRKFYPIDGVLILVVLLSLAASGPAWKRLPSPLVAETAPLVVVLKVTESMLATDIAPSRLERSRQKILDLVSARAGARTALIAYAGTAHRVAPLTNDINVLRPILEGLTPDIMPKPGDEAVAALSLAEEELQRSEVPGAILFVADDMAPTEAGRFQSEATLLFLLAAPFSVNLPQVEATGAQMVRMTPDDADIEDILRRADSAYQQALADDDRLSWDDAGVWLAWPAALLLLIWFRRGWTMRWAMLAGLALITVSPGPARAEGWIDWFLTPDQQGSLAYEDKEYGRAAETFQDPMWATHAAMKDGQYAEAADLFAGIETAQAAFAEGYCRIRNRQYRDGVRAYEKALDRQPDFPEAAQNLEVAKAIVKYVEETQAQSDTGEERGVGADDVVFDNESGMGTETQIEAPTGEEIGIESADQWMRTVDTQMGDFLKSRFLLENARREQ